MSGSPRRHGRARHAVARSIKPRPDDRYGPGRLAVLYEISKILTHEAVTIEETVPALLAIASKELPLRSAILIEKTTAQPKTIAWHSSDTTAPDRRSAEDRAMKSFAFLTHSAAPPLDSIGAKTSALAPPPAGARASHRAKRGRFITCPLIVQGQPIFGTLHVEGFAPFDEEDAEFVSAIADQFAVALDRYQGRLHEIALRKQAEELNEFKTDLVSVVSHEFGNALTVMKVATSILQQKTPSRSNKESERIFDMILTNIDALNRAVQNLLNMGRLEAGKLAIDFAPTDAAGLLNGVRKGLELLCENKGIRVSMVFPDDLRPVRADPASLTLVLSNLLSNAIKYTPAHGRIVLGILSEKSRPGFYRLYVQDSGIGVPEEDRAKILGGHFRSESGKKMTAKGFGVGLSLAQQIVEAHGSTIEIEGGPGKGSRFSFLLPVA
jgi:signal transduction histidine kinase